MRRSEPLVLAARWSRSPRIWSASTGAPRSMSRNIDAVNGEFGAVSIVRVRSANSGRGEKPSLAAIAVHSAKSIAPQMKSWGLYELYRQQAEQLRTEKEGS